MTLQDFVNKQKTFSMEKGLVAIVRTDTSPKPSSMVDEISHILKESDSDAMDIKAIPQSPLPLFVKNTFIDVEDDAFEVDPRRSSSEPPSCRHRDQARPKHFGFKRSDSGEDLSASTASGPGSPR